MVIGLTKPRPVIGGDLHNRQTGYPLVSLTVTAELRTLSGEVRVVGSAVSDAGGRFLVFPDARAEESLLLIGQRGVTLLLSLADQSNRGWLRRADMSDSAGSDAV